MSKDIDLFGNKVEAPKREIHVVDGMARTKSGSFVNNPLVRLYGEGPSGKRCKHCKHLTVKERGKNYYKCDLRTGTFGARSPKSDHRVNWPACGKFEPEQP